ncbi:hypothetical protein Scep_030188 [Stephania cephalantha]|uniref:Uncharacterized protein n=1 Tax=Stephania cephalantha TaxID=152367 RepID=A0AAP0E3L0_9MAGN
MSISWYDDRIPSSITDSPNPHKLSNMVLQGLEYEHAHVPSKVSSNPLLFSYGLRNRTLDPNELPDIYLQGKSFLVPKLLHICPTMSKETHCVAFFSI